MWRFLWLIPVYLLIASVPLLFHTGQNLEYEYTFVVSILSLLIIPLCAFFTRPDLIPMTRNQYGPYIKFEVIWIFLLGPMIALLPGYFAFAVRICPCSFNGFNFWMALQFYPSWILSHAIYELILFARVAQIRTKRLIAAWLGIYALLLFEVGVKLWFFPQKRLTDLLLGFVHGPIYDRWIPVDSGIMWSRVAHICIATLFLVLAWHKQLRYKKFWIGLTTCAWLVLAILASRYPSTSIGKDAIESNLSVTMPGNNFTLHLSKKTEQASEHVRLLFAEAQFHVEELRAIFGNKAPHVDIYVYPDDTTKKLLFGGGSTDITDVYTPSIHITDESLPHPSLRHELVHALASEIAFHGLGFHPNMAFTEGLAVALAPEERDISIHDGVAAMAQTGRLPKMASLFSPMFWRESGPRAYTVAGSIIIFLHENYGAEAIKKLYAGASWESVFGNDRRKVLLQWRDSVLKGFNLDKFTIYSEALFREPGVLADLCPHSKAALRKSRSHNTYVRLQQPVGWDPETDYLPWRLKLDPNDNEARIEQWRAEVNKLSTQRVLPEARLRTWAEVIQRARHWPPQHIEDIEMAVLESDIVRLTNGPEASASILRPLLEFSKTKYYGNNLLRQVVTRLEIEKSVGNDDALMWRRYLAGWTTNILERTATEESWIVEYLRLRRGQMNILEAALLKGWLKDNPPPETMPQTFKVEWYKFLGFRLMQIGQYSDAEAAFKQAKSVAPKALAPLLDQYQRQAAYFLRNLK